MAETLNDLRVAFNGLFWGRATTGSGQYVMKLVRTLLHCYPENRYLLALHQREYSSKRTGADESLTGLDKLFLSTPVDRLGENWAKLWFEQITFPRVCWRQGADVAHVPYWGSPLWSSVPTVVTIHDLIPLMFSLYRGNLLVRAYSALVSRSARRAAHIVTDSNASRQDIITMLKVAPEKVKVVYLAADENFRPVTDRRVLAYVQAKYRLPERYILYLGGFDARKNVAFLLQAYAHLVQEWPQAPNLVLAGRLPEESSEFFPDPRLWIERLDLHGKAALIGWVDEEDKPALYSGADVFVFPSDYEGFGLPALEAISCGTPAVVTEAGSLPEIVGEGGLRVQVGNLLGLTQAMGRIARDRDFRELLREKALSQAALFTWERAAEQMMALYANECQRARG
mgnify:CR=1 FL=1